VQARLDRIGADLVKVQERTDVTYSFTALDTDIINAFAAPGGPVFVTRGLLQMIAGDDDMLAGVMGHEVRHIVERDSMDQLSTNLALQLGINLASPSAQDTSTAAEALGALVQGQYSQADEFEADRGGLVYAVEAGYDGHGLINFLKLLLQLEEASGNDTSGLGSLFADHPLTQTRIERLTAQLAEMET
jgi:beta-barrel assembly-enhancing protease